MSLLSIDSIATSFAFQDRMFSVDQISRNGNQFINRLSLDDEQRRELRVQRIGLFIEGFLGLETMLGRVLQIGQRWKGDRLVACYSSKLSGGIIYDQMTNEGLVPFTKKVPSSWTVGKMTFTSIEALPRFRKERPEGVVEAVFVLDSNCMVHHARTMHRWNGTIHDRPGLVSNFLADEADSQAEPLLIAMTRQKAMAIDTMRMARMYNREAWYYCDGPSISVPTQR
jgi:hypothetical protein